jgi:hypothetical protein
MDKRKPITPRNPLVAKALFRKAGRHQKSTKAARRSERVALVCREPAVMTHSV